MPITTHKGTTPAEHAGQLLDVLETLAMDEHCPEAVIVEHIAAALTEAHRSGAIEALTQARDALCRRCAAGDGVIVDERHAFARCPCPAVEVRRLLEEYAKPTAGGTR
jgi:hypothetical protein